MAVTNTICCQFLVVVKIKHPIYWYSACIPHLLLQKQQECTSMVTTVGSVIVRTWVCLSHQLRAGNNFAHTHSKVLLCLLVIIKI